MALPLPPPQVRQWIYNIVLVAVPLLIFYGVIGREEAPLWIALAGAVLGQGLSAITLSQQRRVAADLRAQGVAVRDVSAGRHAKPEANDGGQP